MRIFEKDVAGDEFHAQNTFRCLGTNIMPDLRLLLSLVKRRRNFPEVGTVSFQSTKELFHLITFPFLIDNFLFSG